MDGETGSKSKNEFLHVNSGGHTSGDTRHECKDELSLSLPLSLFLSLSPPRTPPRHPRTESAPKGSTANNVAPHPPVHTRSGLVPAFPQSPAGGPLSASPPLPPPPPPPSSLSPCPCPFGALRTFIPSAMPLPLYRHP
jgi:hypothetical protein